jgi:general secretion pathway protein J
MRLRTTFLTWVRGLGTARTDWRENPTADRKAGCARPARQPAVGQRGFTLVEIMVAIAILSLVLAAVYSTWTAILRASRVGLAAAASVQRARIAGRVLEDSLSSAQSFMANRAYYGFVVENGDNSMLSFVSHLSKSFPRSGKFGDLDVRRLTFSVESGSDGTRQLVLRQSPLVMDLDVDEKEHPLVLAKNVRQFLVELWDPRLGDWIDDWKQTNELPRQVKITLKLADTASSSQAQEEVVRVVNIAAMAVAPVWQVPRFMPGMNQGGLGLPPNNQNLVTPPATSQGQRR